MRLVVLTAAVFLVLESTLGVLTTARAQEQKTFSTTGTSWRTAGNWSPSGVPTSSDNVLISSGSSQMTLTASNLTIQYITSTNASSRIFENSTSTSTASNLTLAGVDGSGNLINVNNASGTPNFTIRNGGTGNLNLILGSSGNFNVNTSGTLTISSAISESGGARSITKTGAGLLSLGGANTLTGTVALNSGTLALANVNALQNSTLNTGSTGSQTVTFTISGSNTYNIGGLSGADALAISTNNLSVGANNSDSTYDGTISGAGGLIKVGNGNTSFAGSSSFTGGTTISAGTLTLGHAADTLADGGAVSVNGGTLAIGSNSDTVGAVTISSGNITGLTGTLTGSSYSLTDTGSISARLGGSGGLTKTGNGTAVLSGANTYTGATNVNGGTLTVNGSLASGSAVTVGSGATLAGSGAVAGTVALNGGTANMSSGSTLGAVTTTGSSQWNGLGTASSVNVSSGTLTVGSGATLTSSGAVTVASGATLNGSGTVAGNVSVSGTLAGTGSYGATTIASGGTLAPGNSPGNLSFTSLDLASGSNFKWELTSNTTSGGGTNFDIVTVSGNLSIGNITSSLIFDGVTWADSFWSTDKVWTVFTSSNITSFGNFVVGSVSGGTGSGPSTSNFAWTRSGNNVNLTYTANVTAVPEPTSFAFGMFAVGLGALVHTRCRRPRKLARIVARSSGVA